MRKERLARGWSLREFAARTGVNIAQASRIENGKSPPTEKVAAACDVAFAERKGWFGEYYEESKSWMPAGFAPGRSMRTGGRAARVVAGHHRRTGADRGVCPCAAVDPSWRDRAGSRRAAERPYGPAARLLRDGGPAVGLLADMAALYRAVGSAEVMAAQCAHLAEVAELDAVTLQVVPPVAIPLGTASLILAGDAAYTENALSGSVYTDEESVRGYGG